MRSRRVSVIALSVLGLTAPVPVGASGPAPVGAPGAAPAVDDPAAALEAVEAAARGLPAWGTERVPQPGSGRSTLRGMSVLGVDEAWAVGHAGFEYDDATTPLVERWDGSRWSVVPAPHLPGAVLYDVVAVDADDVWMVGTFNSSREALILHWDGTSVEQVDHPNPGANRNDLYAVTASGPDDVWAVGTKTTSVGDPLALHWNGRQWSEVAVPKTGSYDNLYGVTAIAPDDVWAVGVLNYAASAMHWDGETWTQAELPTTGSTSLRAVSAAASNEVWAVGQDEEGTLALRWDGRRWREIDPPDSGGFLRDDLTGVVALAADDVWAVGSTGGESSSLALHWDGTEWSPVRVPGRPDSYDQLEDVDARPGGPLFTAGAFERQAFVLRLEDGALRRTPVEQVGTSSNQLLGISASDPADVWAVGTLGQFNPEALTLHYDGDRWRRVRAPSPRAGTQLNDVVAIDADDAWAVGQTNPADFGSAVALHWDGERWQRVRVPQPGDQYASPRLLAVDAIASDDVWAVGGYDVGGEPVELMLHWNGTRWRQVDEPLCDTYGALAGISFLAPDDGWVVSHASTCHWDGRRWTFVPTPLPDPLSFEIDYPLEDVSGAAVDDVWTVGTVVYDFQEYVTFGSLAFHWDGTAWQRVFNPSGTTLNAVEAVATDDVWAVGRDAYGPSIVRWNGSAWTDIPTPDREDGIELEGLTRAGDELWNAGRSLAPDDGFRSLVQRAPSPTEGAILGTSNIGGATVSWFGPEDGSVETAPTGDFQVGGLPAGRYLVTLNFEGCPPASREVEIVAGRTRAFDIRSDCS